MDTYQEQVEEFQKSVNSVIDESVLDLSAQFDSLIEKNNTEEILNTIETAKTMLSRDYNIPTQMQIAYNIANGYDYIQKNNRITESFLEKAMYYLRYTLDLYEKHFTNDNSKFAEVAHYIAMRAYTNLGNLYVNTGRYISAIQCYSYSLLICRDFAMSSLNLSIALFYYSTLQIKEYEQFYFHHAFYHYYIETENNKSLLEEPAYLDNLKKYILQFKSEYINKYLVPPLQFPAFEVDNQPEADYRNYILIHNLFLDPCLEISHEHCFAVDSIHLPFKEPYSDKEKEYIGLFNQIKQEYNWARFLWYKASTEKPLSCFSDRELDLIDTKDFSDYSLNESLLKTAFKSGYSLFDRIGFFINSYFEIGLTGTRISFKNIWKSKEPGKKGNSIPHPIMESYSNNPLVRGMYWLQKDFYEKEEINITSPNAEPIFKMRNDMEHNCLRTGQSSYPVSFTKYTTKETIINNTYRLLSLARELIIYLCLAINFEEKKKE